MEQGNKRMQKIKKVHFVMKFIGIKDLIGSCYVRSFVADANGTGTYFFIRLNGNRFAI
jgi:hypothetical protein